LNNPEVRNAMFQKYSAEINFKSVKFSKLPQLWAEASYKTVLSDNYSGVRPIEDKSFFLKLNWPIYAGGVYKYKHNLAEKNLQLAEFNLEDVKYRVSKELKDIFFQIELNNKRLALMKESKSMAENMLKIAEIKFKNGMISYREWQFVVDKYKQIDQEYYDAETESLLLYVRLLKTAGLCEEDVLWRK